MYRDTVSYHDYTALRYKIQCFECIAHYYQVFTDFAVLGNAISSSLHFSKWIAKMLLLGKSKCFRNSLHFSNVSLI